MNLHEHKVKFRKYVLEASLFFRMAPGIVEKDYYAVCVLKRITENVPFIAFKGGTSLSKCFRIIQRFSEDVDISFCNGRERATQNQRQTTNRAVRTACQNNGFGLCELKDGFRSNREFNSAAVKYDCLFKDSPVQNRIKVELSCFLPIFPTVRKEVVSYVGEYLYKTDDRKTAELYDLLPFSVCVQSVERTFIDKVFALCDYYIEKNITGHSRHIYDLHCLYADAGMDADRLRGLAAEVRELRRKWCKKALSAGPEHNISGLLQQIIDERAFRDDYNSLTKCFLFNDVPYSTVIRTLSEIAGSGIF